MEFSNVFDNLLKITFEGSILILIITILRKIMKNNFKKSVIYYLWIVLIIKMLIPFSIESSISLYNLFPQNKLIGSTGNNFEKINEIDTEKINLDETLIESEKNIETNKGIGSYYVTNIKNQIDVKNNENINNNHILSIFKVEKAKGYLVSIWFMVVMILSSITTIKYRMFIKKLNNEENFELESLRLESIFIKAKEIIEPKKKSRLRLTKLVSSPMLIGFIRPIILIPKDLMKSLSDKEIEFILMHELSHLKRQDIIIVWLFKIVEILNFYNPLVKISGRLMKEDCEEACDEYVLSKINKEENLSYGNTIIKVIENVTFKDRVIGGATMASNKKDLKSRIRNIKENKSFNRKSIAVGVLIIVVILIMGISTGKSGKEINIKATENLTLKVYLEMSGAGQNNIRNKVIENKEDIETIIDKIKYGNLKESKNLKEDPIRIEILSEKDSIFVYKDFVKINNDKYKSDESYFNEILDLYEGLDSEETFYRENEIEVKDIFEVYPDLRKEMDNILEFHGYKVEMNSLTYEVGKLPEWKDDYRNGINVSSDIDEIIRFSNSFNYNNGYKFADSEGKIVHIIRTTLSNIDESTEELKMGYKFTAFVVNGEIKGYCFDEAINVDIMKVINYLTYYPKEAINSDEKRPGLINGINFVKFAYLNDVEITKLSTEELSKPTLSYKAYLHTIEVEDGKILVYEFFDKKSAEIETKGIYQYKEEGYLFKKEHFINYSYINTSDRAVILYSGVYNENIINMIEKFQSMKYTTLWN